MSEMSEFLRGVPLFAGVDESALTWLESHLSELEFHAGDVLFNEGDPGNAVAFLVRGRLSVEKRTDDGGYVNLGAIYPQEFFGEMGCIEPGPRNATVTATTSSQVLFMSNDVLNLISATYPSVGVSVRHEILRLAAKRLREVDARTELVFEQGRLLGDPPPEAPEPKHLRAVEMLQSFSDAELAALYRVARPVQYPEGHVLARQGDPADACYLILRGSIAVSRVMRGEERRLTALQAGAMVGIVGLVDDAARSATLVTDEPSAIMTLKREDFRRLLAAESAFAVRFQFEMARSVVGQLRAANRRLARLNQPPVDPT